ncbi:MAG: hypothetical protein HC819_15770 [Cyclobacteriaceae bacterium]|nr:hypothetical protein [Cyclobacteriaceae bacterium]
MKTLAKTILFLLVVFVIGYFSANYVLRKLAVNAIATLQPRLEQKGIVIENFDYAHVRMNSYNSCAVTGVDLGFHLNKKMYGKESFNADFSARSITFRFADFNEPSFFFTFKDFSLFIHADGTEDQKTFGKLENGYMKTRIPLYLKTPVESAKIILAEMKKLFNQNHTPMDLELEADALLGIDGKEIKVGLFTQRQDNLTYLRLNEQDILKAADEFDLELAEKEAQIISEHPGKVPAMIKITRDAKKLSELEKSKNPRFPEDAYRHIYWSYHLTRTFGPELSKEITDAHETLPGNTKKERSMDYHNNEVARKFADETLSAEEIKDRVLNAPEIIRSPRDVR